MDERPGSPWRTRDGLWIGLAWLAVSVPAFWVWPALDNWSSSRPIPHFSWELLRPDLFWRPLEKLNLLVPGTFPRLYPWYLHLVAVLGHGASAVSVYTLSRGAGASSRTAAWATSLFLLSPAVGAAVWNVHGITQTWSTAFGLASIVAYLRFQEGPGRAAWLALAALSVLWKESGVTFFLAAPLFGELVYPGARRSRLPRAMLAGIASVAAYLVLREALGPSSILGRGEGRYALHADPVLWAQNLAMLLGVSLTATDTVALFGSPRRLGWATASLLAGLPLLGLAARAAVLSWSPRRRTLAAGLGLLMVAVYLPMGHVSEKYAHTLVALLTVLLAGAFDGAGRPPSGKLRPALAAFLVAAVCVDAHKLGEMIRTGRGAGEVGDRIVARTIGPPPRHVCVLVPDEETARVYSVFVAEPGPASLWGASVLPLWGWRHPLSLLRAERREECRPWSDTLWTVWVDGRVRIEPLQPSARPPRER